VLVLDERDARVERLTARERQILEHVASGKENNEIALTLRIAPATVAKHLEHIYVKLGVANRTAAAAVFTRGEAVAPNRSFGQLHNPWRSAAISPELSPETGKRRDILANNSDQRWDAGFGFSPGQRLRRRA
jgi:DNA-binding CsgD family transcriptional regulator